MTFVHVVIRISSLLQATDAISVKYSVAKMYTGVESIHASMNMSGGTFELSLHSSCWPPAPVIFLIEHVFLFAPTSFVDFQEQSCALVVASLAASLSLKATTAAIFALRLYAPS